MGIPDTHQEFIVHVTEKLKQDERLLGLSIAGSYVDGHMDEYSDVDFVIVVKDEYFDEIMAERQQTAASLGDLLVGFTGEHVGEPRLLICLYDQPLLHVDYKWVTLHDFQTQRVEDPHVLWEVDGALTKAIQAQKGTYPPLDLQWFEDRIWVWVHYAASKLRRGEHLECASVVLFFQERILASMAKIKAGYLPRGYRHFERELPDEIGRFQATIDKCHRPETLKENLRDAALFYKELRAACDPDSTLTLRTRAERAAMAYLEAS